MSDVIGKGVIEVSADARKLTAGIDEAKRSLKSLGIAAGDATKGQSASIDKYIKSLGMAAVTAGKTGRELELYKLALRGANAEQLKAADSALRMAEGYERGERIGKAIKTGLLALGAAAATGLIATFIAFDRLTKKASEFQGMSEKMGDTAEAVASLAMASGASGVAMETVVSASARMTQGLTGVGDESKAAGAAVAALGLNLKDFKSLAPTDQMEAVAKALKGFQDGAQKTAVVMALFGKSGAEMMPFFNDLAGATGRQIILTQAQIAQADEYAKKQDSLRRELTLHAQAIATQMIPAYNAFTEALIDTAKEALGMRNGIKGIADDDSIKEFAQDGALLLANLADVAYDVAGAFRFVGNNLGAMAAIAAANLRLDFAGARAIGQASDEQNEKILRGLGLADKVQARIDAMNARGPARSIGRSGRDAADANKLPELKFDGVVKKSSGGGGAGKAQLATDLSDIKAASDVLTNTYGNAQKIMEAMRSAGLVDERDYYASKLAFLNLNNQAQEDALKAEIARLQAEKLGGKDKLDNLRKITEAQAKLDKLRENSATSVQLLSIQEEAATKKLAQYYRDAEAAAQDYLDTISKAQRRDLAGMGVGNQERDRTSGRAQIEDKYGRQLQDLNKSRRDAELNGTFGEDAQKKYDDEMDRIRRFQKAALSEYDAYFDQRMTKEKDWAVGASEAMANYISDASNIAKQSEKVFTDAFQGMEDALVSFVQTGKLDFQSLANSIVADITRIIIKQQISNALGIGGSGGGGGGGGGGFGMIGSLIGAAAGAFMPTGGYSTSTALGLANASGGGLDDFIKFKNFAAGGLVKGPGSGTSDSINTWLSNEEFVTKAEQTRKWLPLLEAINSGEIDRMPVKKFAQGGLVTNYPNSPSVRPYLSGSNGDKQPKQDSVDNAGMVLHQTVNFVNNGPVDRRTQAQVGAAAYSAGARLTARNN